jgi:hypothetical protein
LLGFWYWDIESKPEEGKSTPLVIVMSKKLMLVSEITYVHAIEGLARPCSKLMNLKSDARSPGQNAIASSIYLLYRRGEQPLQRSAARKTPCGEKRASSNSERYKQARAGAAEEPILVPQICLYTIPAHSIKV